MSYQCALITTVRSFVHSSSHNLVNTVIGMPDLVQILDLRNNAIGELTDTSFWQLRHLYALHLDSNHINIINLYTFSGLPRLRNISLAHNRIETFDSRIFVPARNLRWLDLSGNKFMGAANSPLLRSSSLRELRLVQTDIEFIGVRMLAALPALESLDLSDNLLITLHAAAFATNAQLSWLSLVNNPFNCDGNLRAMLGELKKRRVEVINYDCGELHINYLAWCYLQRSRRP